ncbi:MAG: FG-GAP-like repeat-containing protein [Rubripirellula sp.]
MRRGQWQEAWEFSAAVLDEHPNDADSIGSVARVAHELGKAEEAADLLVSACRAESFQDQSRVQQAMIAVISVGKLYEGMAMLEDALEQQPMQHETRRWLFDFYIGTENRTAAAPHGRFLVRYRKFDLELLKALSNTERRVLDDKPLEEMTSRNPNDKRPLLGAAKREFDEGKFDESVQILQTIVAAHEDYLPARALLGRALAASRKEGRVEQWAVDQPPTIEAYCDYWIAAGDWARGKERHAAAVRAYWEATKRDPDMVEAWSKLSTALQQLQSQGTEFPQAAKESVELRATRLSTFAQLKDRFERTGSISRATVVDIAKTLSQLGRLWEAEAWASIALTLPEDESAMAKETRNEIVARLSKETPWQLESLPEFGLNLAEFELPSISKIAADQKVATSDRRAESGLPNIDTGGIQLRNEAADRGLNFFGRTSDKLDQPGIGLHETLGCGGGTIDFDLDGWSDLYLIAAGGDPSQKNSEPNALMRNVEGRFVNVARSSLTDDRGFGQGVAVGDVNEDGFPDLMVLNYGPNSLLINNGDGTFTDASGRLAGGAEDWSTSGAIADLDGDGISDVVVLNYCAGLDPVTDLCPMKDSDVSRSCTPMKFPGLRDHFLQGTGSGDLVDRTDDWNAVPSVVGRGLGIVVGSLDGDPGIDVFVANDMTNNHYWSGRSEDGAYRMTESAMLRGLGGDDRAAPQGSMGIAVGDMDGDGDADLYVTNFDNEYNTFHEQRGSGIWQDLTSKLKLAKPTVPLVGFGSESIDLDNDGVQELVVTNGHVDMFSRGEEKSVYAHPIQVFRRNAANQFDSIAANLGGDYVSSPHVGRALWTIDVNRDGLTDFAITHQTEPVSLLVNRTAENPVARSNRWIEIQLRGRACSRDAIGATLQITTPDGRQLTVPHVSGSGYECSNDSLLRVGIGNASDCKLDVTWADGTSQSHRNLASQASWLIVQSDPSAFRVR